MTRLNRTHEGVGQISRWRLGSDMRLTFSSLRALRRALRAASAPELGCASAMSLRPEVAVGVPDEGLHVPAEERQPELRLLPTGRVRAGQLGNHDSPLDHGL